MREGKRSETREKAGHAPSNGEGWTTLEEEKQEEGVRPKTHQDEVQ